MGSGTRSRGSQVSNQRKKNKLASKQTTSSRATFLKYRDRSSVSTIAIVLSPLSIFMYDYQSWYLWEYGEFRSFGEGNVLVILALLNLTYCLFAFPFRTFVDLKRDINRWTKVLHCINALLFVWSLRGSLLRFTVNGHRFRFVVFCHLCGSSSTDSQNRAFSFKKMKMSNDGLEQAADV